MPTDAFALLKLPSFWLNGTHTIYGACQYLSVLSPMNMLSPAIQVGDMVNGGHLDPFAIPALYNVSYSHVDYERACELVTDRLRTHR